MDSATAERASRGSGTRAELECRVRELEAFAGMLAHELATPLGQIESIVSLLNRGEGPEGRWLRMLGVLATEAREAVGGMLELTRGGDGSTGAGAVDLSSLCHGLAQRLRDGGLGLGVQWHIQPGMAVRGCRPRRRPGGS